MQSTATTPDLYVESLPEDRKAAISELRKVIKKNLPKGFEEMMNYGMPGWAVPHSIYPPGYHRKPSDPLPFMGIASQKNFIALYHMGIYADKKLYNWFVKVYSKVSKNKLDMGKSCLRYKKPEDIPYKLIGELVSKITPDDWIEIYERNYKNNRKTK